MEQNNVEKTARSFGPRAILVLAGGILMHIALGQSYTVGNFAPYFISYIRNRTDDTGIQNVDVLWVGPVVTCTSWTGFIAAGLIDRAVGPRITSLIFSFLFSGSIAASYFCIQASYVAYLSMYALVNGLAMAAMYGVSVQTTVKWFPGRSSFASGLILSGYGAGALVFNQVITQFINPDNLSPDLETEDGDRYFTDPDLLDRVPYCHLLLGGIYLCLTVTGSLVMVSPPTSTDDLNIEVEILPKDEQQTIYTLTKEGVPNDQNSRISGCTGSPTKQIDFDIMSNDYESLKIGSDSVNLNSINAVDDSLNEGDGGVIVRGNSVKYEDSISDRVADSVNKLTDNVKCIDKSDDSVNKVADGVNKDEDSVSCGDRFKDGAHKAVDSVNKDEESVKSVILLVLRTRSFYVIFLQILFTVWAFAFINGLYKAYGQTFISDDHFLALIGTLASVFNSLGRPLWGLVMDRFGYKMGHNNAQYCKNLENVATDLMDFSTLREMSVTFRCISGGLAVLFATLFLTEDLPKWCLMIWICLLFLVWCGVWAACPSVLAKLFGARNVSILYGMVDVASAIGTIAVLVTGTTLKNAIGWHGMFFLSAGLAVMPFVLTFAFNGVDSEGKRI